MMADMSAFFDGSVVLVVPISNRAKLWVKEYVDVPDYMWLGSGFCCEPRLAGDMLLGAERDGLEVFADF